VATFIRKRLLVKNQPMMLHVQEHPSLVDSEAEGRFPHVHPFSRLQLEPACPSFMGKERDAGDALKGSHDREDFLYRVGGGGLQFHREAFRSVEFLLQLFR
jgi:hypothetical protein